MHKQRAIVLVALLVVAAAAAVPVSGTATGAPAENVESLEQSTDDCELPYTATDATGTEVTVEERPEGIVALGPGTAQTLVEIGAGDRIVGATEYASYLNDSDGWANVSGSGQTFTSVETVVAQEPDLVIAENIVPNETIQQLRSAGIMVYKFRSATGLQDVYDKVNRTGRLVDEPDAAAETVAEMQHGVRIAKAAADEKESPMALYHFFGYTSGQGTFIDEIITAAGGTNVAAEAGITGYKQISQEVVANNTVEWLLLNSGSPSVPGGAAYQETIAVTEDQTVVLNENYISQPGPRIIQPIVKLSKAFYPDAYEEAASQVEKPTDVRPACAPTTTPEPTASGPTETAETTDEETTTAVADDGDDLDETTTASDEQSTTSPSAQPDEFGLPGFTPVMALLAILGSVALLARRDR
ncbi:MAG: iron complex transport system substrate-binding protein [Halobacteriales archaeon]|jgi:iron complex transport system substrate-binding protein